MKRQVPSARREVVSPSTVAKGPKAQARLLTARDLRWSREEAAAVRAKLSSFAADWDDPAMNVYDEA
jgi:hypothetical protein